MSRLLGLAGAVAGILALSLGCVRPVVSVPSELRGRWTTAAEGFVGRAMIFTPDSVTFETGEGPPEQHAVVGVEAGSRDSSPMTTVIYQGAGGNEYRLALLHDADSRSLRLANRSDVLWTKNRE